MNNAEIASLIDKSTQSIDAANHLLIDSFADYAAARAYYAMFYSLEALFLSRNQSYSKHSAIISAFGKDFVKTGIFEAKLHQYLLEAFDLRNAGDYGVIHSVSNEKAKEIITKAEEFVTAITAYISGL